MNSNKSLFLHIVYFVLWISIWSIFNYIVSRISDEQNRLLVYFGFALVSIYIIRSNNV